MIGVKENVIPENLGGLRWLPSRELTYPTWGKGNASSKVPFYGIC